MELAQEEIVSATFTSHRDITIVTEDGGQCSIFEAGKPKIIGKRLFKAAINAGLIPEGPLEYVPPAVVPNRTQEEVVTTGLLEACKTLIERARKEDFTPVGHPRMPAVKKLVDFDFTVKDMKEAFALAMHEVDQDGDDSKEHSEPSSEPAE